jgi:SMI1 / KNR4 family (SUKH-1)
MESDAPLAEQVLRFWSSVGLTIRPGVSEAALAEFEARYGVVLPPDMRAYFKAVDGMNGEMDDQRMVTFWPLEQVKRVTDELPGEPRKHESYFLFADFLIWSHGYAIRLSADSEAANPVVIVPADGTTRRVAESFSDFITRYLADDQALWG